MKLPEGYDASMIEPNSLAVFVAGSSRTVPGVMKQTGSGRKAMLEFDRQQLIAALQDRSGPVALTITGAFGDGQRFAGSDTITVKH